MTELQNIQKALGCLDCYYADQKAIKKGEPCCTKPGAHGKVRPDGSCPEKRPIEAKHGS